MSEEQQPFFMPGTQEEYDAAEAFKTYWLPEDGSVQEYVITGAINKVRKNSGQTIMELELRAVGGQHDKKEPRPLGIPHDPKFLFLWKGINNATGVQPKQDANTGRPFSVPGWYKGKHFLATAVHRVEPHPTKPGETVTYCDLRNFMAVGGAAAEATAAPQAAPVAQPQPAPAPVAAPQAAPTPMMSPTPTAQAAPVPMAVAAPVQAAPVARRTIPGT